MIKQIVKDYFAPAYRWGWWSVLIWVVVLVIAAVLTYLELKQGK